MHNWITLLNHLGLVMMAFSMRVNYGTKRTIQTTRMISHVLTQPEADGMICRIQENNDLGGLRLENMVALTFSEKDYGFVSSEFAQICSKFKDVFFFEEKKNVLKLSDELSSIKSRTDAIHLVNLQLREDGLIKGWRDEMLPVVNAFSNEPVFLIERAAYSHFGMKGYGVHVNGYVRDEDTGEIGSLWVAKRSAEKSTWPGMLDHIVAGGQPYGISLADNVIKECGEEASIPPDLAKMARCGGAVSYCSLDEHGQLKRDSLFCYDLELPPTFIPTPGDKEVEDFQLLTIPEIIEIVARGGDRGYKPNCNLVVIDFLVRHGLVAPESPRYLEIVAGLRVAATCK